MEMKHTQGEWIIFHSGEKMKNIFIAGNKEICELSFELPQVEKEANAKLIAAAPDLLEALIQISDYWQSGNFSRSIDLQNKIQASIKKATE